MGHRDVEERRAVRARQARPEHHLRLLGINIHTGKGKHLAKGHRIHLNHGARDRRGWHGAPQLICPTTRAHDVAFSQNLIDLGDGEVKTLFTCEKVLNLLPAAVVLANANRPDETLHHAGGLPPPARPLLRRGIALQKGGQPIDPDGLQPQPDCLPMAVQLSRVCSDPLLTSTRRRSMPRSCTAASKRRSR